MLESAYLPGAVNGTVSGLATDSGNDLIVFGQTVTQTVQSTPAALSSQPIVPCESNNELSINNDSYVMKLSATDWQPVYIAVFRASCGVNSGAMGLEPNGDIVLAFGASAGLPLSGPLLAGPACTSGSAVAKLSADGTTLEYATYLPGCGLPAMTLSHDGSVYAGVTALPDAGGTSLLHVTTANSEPIALNQISNAFSGDASALVGGGLYTLGIGGFQPPPSNLGLDPSANLPDELNGVQVLFDGVAGSILSTGAGTVIAAAPLVMFQVPGLISSVFQILVPIPENRTFNGTNVGDGVQQVSFALLLFVPIGDLPQPVSNVVNVYVKGGDLRRL